MKSNIVVKLLFTGDYYPFKELDDYVRTSSAPSSIFGDLNTQIPDCDVVATNIEFPITQSRKKQLKTGPHLKGDPVTLLPLKEAGFNLAYLSNNHTLDYGIEGLYDTIKHVSEVGMATVGVGKSLPEARLPFRFEKNGIIVSILNFSENEFNTAHKGSGGANPLDIINNIKDIRQAKSVSDHVFVVVHAGQDFNHYPPPFLVEQLRFYAEEGASAIFCHHSHYISGMEEHQGVPIFYGLGNLIYPKSGDPERNKTLVVRVEIDRKSLKYDVKPYFFSCAEMKLMAADENSEYDFTNQFKQLSDTIKNEELLKEKWFSVVNKQERYRYLILISSYPHIVFKVFKKVGLLPFLEKIVFFRKRALLYKWNLMRREVHRNALLNIFEDIFDDKNH